MIRKAGKWFKKQVRGTEKGKKDKAGSEEARGENVEFEKWKKSGNHKSSEKHLGKNPRFSKQVRCLTLEVFSLNSSEAVPANVAGTKARETLLISKAALLIPSDSLYPRHERNLATELRWPAAG